jgi:putative Ca2+/H+ antiporter (TMEM165/GDT1 family)
VSSALTAAVFGIIFLAELPDKTALASLVLSTVLGAISAVHAIIG